MQDGLTPAYAASKYGYFRILALLLANKAEVNAARKVHELKVLDSNL
jgi:hypothetical protein